ncbi:DUF4349 domain-containing protein [Kitasatospora sp. NPDC093806]|uniref:DUF4349 domain-containing protein n=1 Tax=Kitasatospora sp. NPDC093806 TaxID=3155075 RepID=UPI00344285F1
MRRGRRRAGALAAVAVAAVLAGGCSASGGDGREASAVGPAQADARKADGAAPEAAPAGAPAAGSTAAAGSGAAAPGQPKVAPVVDARQIAYSAQLSVRTDKTDDVLARARGLATAAGGYVASESVANEHGVDVPSGATAKPVGGQITVKVPSAVFQQTLDQLAGLGEVLSRRSQAEDLTQQVADVSSRVQTQQASVDRVRALMAQAKTLAEITSLEGELSRREADLESWQKQLKELSAKTSLSTITLDVRQKAEPVPDAPDAEEEDDGFWHAVGSAMGGGWHVLAAIVVGISVALAAALPFLLVAAPVAVVVWVLRRRKRRAPAVPVPAPVPAPQEEAEEEEREEG